MVERHTYELPMLPPCRVCSKKASGFHYGVNTCEACKGFFRRNLKKEMGECSVGDCGSRKAGRNRMCAACRFQKCLAVGMSRDAIKTGRYTHETKTKNIREVKWLERMDDVSSPPTLALPVEASVHIATTGGEVDNNSDTCRDAPEVNVHTAELLNNQFIDALAVSRSGVVKETPTITAETPVGLLSKQPLDVRVAEMEKIIADVMRVNNQVTPYVRGGQEAFMKQKQLQEKLFGSMKPIPRDEYMLIYNSTGIDVDGRRAFIEHLLPSIEPSVRRLVTFAKALPGFRQLPIADQIGLIKSTRFETSFIMCHQAINCAHRLLTLWWGETIDAEDLCKVHSARYVDLLFTVASRFQKVHLSTDETCLLAALNFFFIDRCSLEEPGAVERSQQVLLRAFSHLLLRNSPADAGKLGRCLFLLPDLRSLTAAYKEEEKKFSTDWNDKVHIPPLFYEMWCV